MSNRPEWKPFNGPVTWPYAIEMAKNGQPQLLAYMLAQLVPAKHRHDVAGLINDPPLQATEPKGGWLPREQGLLRDMYQARLAVKKPGQKVKRVMSDLADELLDAPERPREPRQHVKVETLRQILYQTGPYSPKKGVTSRKSHLKKR